jgi:hypothetical protein
MHIYYLVIGFISSMVWQYWRSGVGEGGNCFAKCGDVDWKMKIKILGGVVGLLDLLDIKIKERRLKITIWPLARCGA